MGKVNFGYSDGRRLSRQVLENGELEWWWSELIFILSLKIFAGSKSGHFLMEGVT